MAGRIRSIKPELIEDEIAASLSDSAWRLWVSTWVLADDYGNVRAGSKYLAASVWQDSGRAESVEGLLVELVSAGFMTAYEHSGQRYAHINGWDKHQRVDNAGKRRVPDKSDPESMCLQVVGGILAVSSASIHVQSGSRRLTSDLRPPTTTSDHDPGLSAAPTPTAPRKARKPKQEEPELPGCTVSRAQFTAAIAAASGGRYTDTPPSAGGLFKLDAPRSRPDALALATRIGQWLAAGGDGFKASLDGRNIGTDLEAWVGHADAWDGKPVLRAVASPPRGYTPPAPKGTNYTAGDG